MDFLSSAVKLICYLCGSVVPQLLILHLYPDWPEAEPEVLQEEVQHVGAADQIVKVYVEVIVEVYTHATWIFHCLLERSPRSSGGEIPVEDEGFTTVGSASGSVKGSGMIMGCICGS